MAAEMVAGALVSTFVQMTIDSLASRFVDFFRGRKLNKKLLSNLKVKLLSIDVVADDAEQKQFRDPRVRVWLLKAKDVVFQAEDLLDEIDYEISKCQVEAESKTTANKLRNFVKSTFVSSFENEIQSRMKQVLEDLDYLATQSGYLGLKRASEVGVGSGSSSKVSQILPSTSLPVENIIYGRDDDKEKIFNWLTSDSDNRNKLSILSIVGMGGLGKTTLAQHVFNGSRIEGKFTIKAWVCVSDERVSDESDAFNFKVTRKVLEEIKGKPDDSKSLQMVQGRLIQELTGKKFLLVLDDVWNSTRNEWGHLLTALKFGAQGSKIVVTTRDMKVASALGSNETHPLSELQGDPCWQLFAKHAFEDDDPQPNLDLVEIGMKIVKKCKGLPLALKSMGILLHNNSLPSEWKSVLQSEIWDLEGNDIVPALALSYHHLPSYLKRCFAYCALFPKGYEFDKEGLIQLWMAENFLLCHQQSKSPEEVGEQCFNDLLSRSFFQQSSNEWRTWFVMHDLLNDLAKYVCEDICIRLGVDIAKGKPLTTLHFSFPVTHDEYFDGFGSLHDPQRLHTFMPTAREINFDYPLWNCKMSIDDLLSKFKLLRILSLRGCSQLGEVPDSVGKLKHLRSLDLSSTNIEKLPESTCSLYNLQILKLNECTRLKELPSELHKLTNLRRLELIDTEVTKVPAHLGKLKNLQVLMSWFVVGKSREFGIQQLGELNLHGSLSIQKLQNIEDPGNASAVDLANKTHLVELFLEWDEDGNLDDSTKDRHENVIENLRPSQKLKELSIDNYGGKQFPRWLSDNSLTNVVSLMLNKCLSCQRLPSLGLLPFLKDLEISMLDGIVSIDADFYGSRSSSFASLETLNFSRMDEWEHWECQDVTGAFPRLQHLSIYNCPKLKGHLPEHLLHLQTLQIYGCEQLVASAPIAPEICKLKLRDCGKVQFDYHPANLKELTLDGDSMEASRIGISDGCDSLITFSLDSFPTLSLICLSKCHNLQIISQGHAHNHLKHLEIVDCPELESLPERMHILLPSLEFLQIGGCPKVEAFPDGGLPSNLKRMSLANCSKLVASLKGAWGPNPSIEYLYIEGMDAECFPEEGMLPVSLTSLNIHDCRDLKQVDYRGLCHLSSLKELHLYNCPLLQCLPESFPDGGLPSNLKRMDLYNCSKLVASLKGAWGPNPSLEVLYIGRMDAECFPEEGMLPVSLTSLTIHDCRDLKQVDYRGLCHLSSLKELSLTFCPKLQCLPEEGLPKSNSTLRIRNCPLLECLPEVGLPKSISTLEISSCPLLQQRCQEPEGEDWPKIAHIKHVRIYPDLN